MSKTKAEPRLYACCTKPDCKTHKELLDFLRLWGLPLTAIKDGSKSYFNISLPDYWSPGRRKMFAAALKGVKSKH